MKKIALLTITVLVALLATSCNKDKTNEYAGKYVGVFSVIVADSIVQTEGELSFTSGVTKEQNLYVYGTQLTKESKTKYISNSSSLRITLFMVFGIDTEQVDDINANFTFSGSKVNGEFYYKLIGATEASLLSFEGNRE